MRAPLRRAHAALLLLLSAVLPVSAQVRAVVPRVSLTGAPAAASAEPVWSGTLSGPLSAAFAAPPSLSLSPALSLSAPALGPAALTLPAPVAALAPAPIAAVPHPSPAPLNAAPAAAPAAAPGAAAPLAAAPSSVGPVAGVTAALDSLNSLSAPADGPRWVKHGGFDGSRSRANVVADARDTAGPKGFIKNPDGVWVGGRVKDQTLWISQMAAQLAPHIDLEDVLDVMDDAYDEARVKLLNAENAARTRRLEAASVHLEGTRNWVDAILTDKDGESIAVHTHRVYFHPGRGNSASEVSEGIRRVGKYLDKAKADFAPAGRAETDLQTRFKEVELNFDTRGYKEIEDYLRTREGEFRAEFGGRFTFNYITEPKRSSARLRAEYNQLVERFAKQAEGLREILDGVTYSRTVGVGHELNSHLQRMKMGLKITQAGRDFFGPSVMPDGTVAETYKTEFDAVTESRGPTGEREVTLWEDKSTRVWLPLRDTVEQTFLYKLRIYRENRALIEASLGAPLKVAFSVDVGGADRNAARMGLLVWKDPRQQQLMEYLKTAGPALSAEYGFPVAFIFVNSHPGERADLFDQAPMSMLQFQSMQSGGGGSRSQRRHGKNKRH